MDKQIRYRRADPYDRIEHGGYRLGLDYWIDVDGIRWGYVLADRAGRAGGTLSHWMAYRIFDQKRIAYAGSMRRMKEDVQRALNKEDA
jgi:macrodomain Ter protein organizer (MatP/YcbG family)